MVESGDALIMKPMLRNDLSVLSRELSSPTEILPQQVILQQQQQQQQQSQQQTESSKPAFVEAAGDYRATASDEGARNLATQFASTAVSERTLDATDVNFHQIFTTIEEECPDQVSDLNPWFIFTLLFCARIRL